MKNLKGFTIIELLVALVIFVVLAFFATQSLANILQSRTKAEVTRAVRQDADYTISVMERHLRGALSVTCVSPTQITYVDPDGKSASFSCTNVGTSNAFVASGSARLTTTEARVTNCVFSCLSTSVVNISLTLQQAKQTTDPRQTAIVSVSSQVALRNK